MESKVNANIQPKNTSVYSTVRAHL